MPSRFVPQHWCVPSSKISHAACWCVAACTCGSTQPPARQLPVPPLHDVPSATGAKPQPLCALQTLAVHSLSSSHVTPSQRVLVVQVALQNSPCAPVPSSQTSPASRMPLPH